MKNKGNSFQNYNTNQVSNISKIPSKKVKSNPGTNMSVFGIIFLFMFIIVLFRVLTGSSTGDITFTGFLQFLSDFSPPDLLMNISNVEIVADWGIFNGLRYFINAILGVFNFALSITNMLINALSFIFECVKWLFV